MPKISHVDLATQSQPQNQNNQPINQILTCPQFLAITPCDLKSWPSLKSKLQSLINQQYSIDRLLKFIQYRYQQLGYANIRLLRKIKTQYFWNAVIYYILKCIIQDSHILVNKIPIMLYNKQSIIKLTKYQIFLIMSHMLLGTWPKQIYNKSINFGKYLTVYNNQDQVTSQNILQYRLNKIKAIARYFCIFTKRSQENQAIKKQVVIFQRSSNRYREKDKEYLLADSVQLCKVYPQVGAFYQNSKHLNKVSLNTIKCPRYNSTNKQKQSQNQHFYSQKLKPLNPYQHQNPLPGLQLSSNHILDLQQRIIFSHLQLLILQLLTYQPLNKYQSIIVHGIQQFSQLDALSKHTPYNFKQGVIDTTQILNKVDGYRNTTLIFLHRQYYNKKNSFDMEEDIKRVHAAMKGCTRIRSINNQKDKDALVSGNYTSITPSLGLNSGNKYSFPHIKQPWQLKFFVQWISASIIGYKSLTYYVQHQVQCIDLKIMAKQMQNYTIKDIISFLRQYWKFRGEDCGRIGVMEFIKDFVV